ncbi:hypothetical protein PO909_016686 [Leuciscus waleckii]
MCCIDYHCPFCSSAVFQSTKLSKVRTHLESHFNRAVLHEGYTIHRCGLHCRPQLHYHCIHCQSMLFRKSDFIKHLSLCKEDHSAITSTLPATTIQDPTTTTTTIASLSTTTTTIQDPTTKNTTIPSLSTTTSPTLPITPSEQMRRVRVKAVLKKKCPICHLLMNKTNLKRHIESTQANRRTSQHLPTFRVNVLIWRMEFIQSTNHSMVPVYLSMSKIKIWGQNQQVCCESTECQVNMELAWRSGLKADQCIHLKSITYCSSYACSPVLCEDTLTEMVNNKWFGEDKKKVCLGLKNLANSNHAPLSVYCKIGTPQSVKYISIYEPTVSYYSRLGRVIVSYDTKKNSWHCPCHTTTRSCIHKYIAKWHLFQTQRELFRKVRSRDENRHEEADLGDIPYPPKDEQKFKVMVQYILNNKKLPVVLPEHLRLPSVEKQYPRHLIPEEMMCQHCPGNVPLSDPILITQKAKILTSSRIVHDVSTYCKSCHQCGTYFRYQEWKDGIHNCNDRILLDLPLCITIRNMLQVHTAVSRVVEYLERTSGVQFPSSDTVLQGYLHFEALTEHDYQYSCVNCGDHPPVVIMDLHKKGAFHLSVSDLSPPPEDFNGEVDMQIFWEALSVERIGRGFVTSQQKNPFTVPPSFHFWAPWIGPKTCRSNHALNTEYKKVRPPKPTEVSEITVTEDRLTEELYKQKVQVVRNLCKECGLDPSGSRADLLLRLSSEMKSRQTYDKVFQKI